MELFALYFNLLLFYINFLLDFELSFMKKKKTIFFTWILEKRKS